MFRAKLLGVVLVTGLVSLGLVVSQVANAGEYVPDANTLLLMHFNEGSGAITAESSFNDFWPGYSWVYGNPWTTGRYGAGIDGDLTNYVSGQQGNTILDAFTVEFWMKGGLSDWGDIIWAPYNAYIYVDANGNIKTVFWTLPNFDANYLHGGQAGVLDNEWHHIAMTYDGSTGKIYVDGVLGVSVSGYSGKSPAYWLAVPYKLYNPAPFAGTIDELRVSTVARTDHEISYGADILSPVAVASVTSPAIEATGVLTDVSAYLSSAGSYDPDGGNITCVFAPVSLPIGTTTVTLTVTDNEGDTATAAVNVKVVDTTPPTITAGLVPVGGSQAEYEVVATATDLVDPNPTVIVTLGVAVEDGQRVNLPPGEGRGHFLIKGATEGVLTVVATDASGKSSVVEVPITR